MGKALAKPLNRRRRITVEVPEFVVRAINCRVEEANENDPADEVVDFNDVVDVASGHRSHASAPADFRGAHTGLHRGYVCLDDGRHVSAAGR